MSERTHPSSQIPLVATIRGYNTSWLRPDVVAGLVLATMLVPQGMAYAELTGLPAETGIYTTIAALIAYALFGPNRRLVLGPDSSLAPVIAAVILPLAAGDPAMAVTLASALSIIAAGVCIVSGLFKLGVVTELLSKPIRIGYLNGIAALILISQIPKALGFAVDADNTLGLVRGIIDGIAGGDVSRASLLVSTLSLLVILVLNRLSRVRPGVVVAAVGSVVAVALFGLEVPVVGTVPSGLPSLTLPLVGWDVLPQLIGGALAVALVSFADTGALSTATSLKSGEQIHPNSEIKALGAANLLSGLFQGFATSASSTRTAVALSLGSRTQVAGMVAAGGVIAIILLVPNVVSDMPSATLAAIVIASSFALFDQRGWRWLYRVRRSEFILSLATALSVLFIGVLEGLGVAILLSLANFIRRAWRPHSTELGKVRGVAGYHDVERHPEADLIEGLLIVRYDAPLFFANAPDFGRRLQELLREAARPIDRILVVANAITDVDSTGAEILGDVLEDLESRDLDFAFAGLKGQVKDRLRAYGLYDRIGDDCFYPNTIAAVEAHQRSRSSPET